MRLHEYSVGAFIRDRAAFLCTPHMNLILGVVVNVAQSEHDRLKGELADEAELSRMMASGSSSDFSKSRGGQLIGNIFL